MASWPERRVWRATLAFANGSSRSCHQRTPNSYIFTPKHNVCVWTLRLGMGKKCNGSGAVAPALWRGSPGQTILGKTRGCPAVRSHNASSVSSLTVRSQFHVFRDCTLWRPVIRQKISVIQTSARWLETKSHCQLNRCSYSIFPLKEPSKIHSFPRLHPDISAEYCKNAIKC